ncbi:MAG: hypothetical protein R3300_19825, partial [Candidatus Promineifilaceae bacterium]|nr:hypothetical protein [Candidatus Promineifilaceae bacterium]
EQIDGEVREIVDEGFERAKTILVDNRDKLELVARTLLDVETLEADEFAALIEGTVPQSDPSPEAPRSEEQSVTPERRETEWKPPSSLDLPPAPSPA